MRHVLGFLKCLGLIFCYALLVLLVPSSAWADDTEQPNSSVSPSPSDGSSTPSSPSASPEVSPSSPPTPAPSSEATPDPTFTETVTIVEQAPPPQAMMAEGTAEDPMIVQLDEDTRSLILLTACLGVGCLGLIAATSFGR